MPATLRLDVWSDVACPWCWVGKRRLERALEQFAHRDQVEVVWRAFELDPSAPPVRDQTSSYAERLARKYGTPLAEAQTMIRQMTEVGAREGVVMAFDRVRSGNMFDAHRLLHMALVRGGPTLQGQTKERLFCAYLTEGATLGVPDVLIRLATELGLEPDEVGAMLASDLYADEVRRDEHEARELGITGVPCFVLASRYAVVGAQPPEALLETLERVWEQAAQQRPDEQATASVCGSDGCA